MSVRLDADRLGYELALRCMSQHHLAKKTGLSDATISAPFAGRPIAEASAELICHVLDATPVSDFMKKLIGPYVPPPAEDEAPRDPRVEEEGDPRRSTQIPPFTAGPAAREPGAWRRGRRRE